MIDGSMLHVISLLQYLLLYPLPSIISLQVCKILIRSTYESFYFSFSFFHFSSMLWRHSNYYSVLPIILLEVEILHYPIDWQRREGRKKILNMYVCEQQGGKGIFPRCPIGPHTETCATPWTTTLLLHIRRPFLSFSIPPCCLITITVNGSMHFIMRK